MTGIIRVHAAGGPEVLSRESVEVAAPGPGELRIRQTAIGINYIGAYYRSGVLPRGERNGCEERSE
jgi:NADPH2:quinone reductase